MNDWEIRAFWQACDEMGAFGRAFRFMLATGQRRSEVGAATWGEIDRTRRCGRSGRRVRRQSDCTTLRFPTLRYRSFKIVPRPEISSLRRDDPASCETARSRTRSPVRMGKGERTPGRIDAQAGEGIALAAGKKEPREIEEWRLHDLRRTPRLTWRGSASTALSLARS